MKSDKKESIPWQFFCTPLSQKGAAYLIPAGFSFLYLATNDCLGKRLRNGSVDSSFPVCTWDFPAVSKKSQHRLKQGSACAIAPGVLYYFSLTEAQFFSLDIKQGRESDAPCFLLQGFLHAKGLREDLFKCIDFSGRQSATLSSAEAASTQVGFLWPSQTTLSLLYELCSLQAEAESNRMFTADTSWITERIALQQVFTSRLIREIEDQMGQTKRFYLTQVLNYVEQHLAEDLSVEKIAAVHGLNSIYLQRLCKEQYNQGLMSLVRQKRLALAKYLLQYTDLSIAEIIFMTGMKSRQVFNAAFRKQFFLRPLQMRQQVQVKLKNATPMQFLSFATPEKTLESRKKR